MDNKLVDCGNGGKCMPGSNTHGNGEYVTMHARKLEEREVEKLGWNLG
jgi:hypothetical protein